MNAAKYYDKLTKPMDELDGQNILEFYSGRWAGIVDMRFDELDAIDEGYLEDLEKWQISSYDSKSRSYRVIFDDGHVRVWEDDELAIHAKLVENPKPEPRVEPTYRRPSPFERTRAMVYATGNRWAIENFNATHC